MKKIVPLKFISESQLLADINEAAEKGADIIELWLDNEPEKVLEVFKEIPDQVRNDIDFLAVCKTPAEKGTFAGTQKEKILLLLDFLKAGGDYVDVDLRLTPPELIDQLPANQLWLSYHDFEAVPADLPKIQRNMQYYSPAFTKIAVTCNDPNDLKRTLSFAHDYSLVSAYYPLILTTMGSLGAEGRKLIREQDLSWGEFYALNDEHKTAEGQPVL